MNFCRIYKAKYMDGSNTGTTPVIEAPAKHKVEKKDKKEKAEALPIPEDSRGERPAGGGRSRSRSIWGKRKSEKPEK